MIEPRIYRAAFVPALLAVVLAMFSLQSRPRPLPQGLPADVVFDGDQAASTARALVDAGEDRRAGTVGDRAAADLVSDRFESQGFTVKKDAFQNDGKDLVNVIGRRAGKSRRQIVVVAARDARGVPDAAGSAADTAALLEIARVFEGKPSRKTLVLASVDGSALGELGTERLVGELDDPDLVDGVIAISGLGIRGGGTASVQPWSNDTTRAGLGLQRTVLDSLREEEGRVGEGASPAGQLARLAFPLGIGPQGVMLEAGYDAVRIAGDGEVPAVGATGPEDLDAERLERLGRATFRTVDALDRGGKPKHGPDTYVTVVSQVMPGLVISLLSLTLILPALAASIDAFARARRRREPVAAWLTWLGGGVLAFVVAFGLAHGLALAGAIPDPPDAPVPPGFYELDWGAAAAMASMALVLVLSWLALRYLARRTDPALADASAPGAAVAVALVLSLALLALWAMNPFSALLLAPALHLWLLGTLVDPPPPRRARVAMVAGGLLLPVLLAVYYLVVLELDPVSGAWYLILLVTGGHLGPFMALIGCVLAGCLGSVVAIVRAGAPREPGQPAEPASVRGPASYAGPGSLGGTESALRR